MNPYQKFVKEYVQLMAEAKKLPLGGFAPLPKQNHQHETKRVLHFSPHPDDECLMSALLIRLQRDMDMKIINVPITLGSDKARRKERYEELLGACDYLGFEILDVQEDGLSNIRPVEKTNNPQIWSQHVEKVANIIRNEQPFLILTPHGEEFNTTHQGTNVLVFDALNLQRKDFLCYVAEWEYWTPMTKPNLLLEVSEELLTDILTGVSFHAKELIRNPQHINLPAWMQDNVRRGCELIGGAGSVAPDYKFATVYRIRKWEHGEISEFSNPKDFLSSRDAVAAIFS